MSEGMKKIAEGYEMIAVGFRMLAEGGEAVPKQEAAKGKPDSPKKETKAQKKELTLETVRAVLAEKSRAGKTQEVRALLKEFGADKLSGVKEDDYPALVKKAEAL